MIRQTWKAFQAATIARPASRAAASTMTMPATMSHERGGRRRRRRDRPGRRPPDVPETELLGQLGDGQRIDDAARDPALHHDAARTQGHGLGHGPPRGNGGATLPAERLVERRVQRAEELLDGIGVRARLAHVLVDLLVGEALPTDRGAPAEAARLLRDLLGPRARV